MFNYRLCMYDSFQALPSVDRKRIQDSKEFVALIQKSICVLTREDLEALTKGESQQQMSLQAQLEKHNFYNRQN